MEPNIYVMAEFVGKEVVIKTHLGEGTRDTQIEGAYKGTLIEYDGNYVKLEYSVKKFVEGNTVEEKRIVLINNQYIISLELFRPSELG